MMINKGTLCTALLGCIYAGGVAADDNEQTYPLPLQACLHHNSSFFNENSEAECFGLENLNGGESHAIAQLPFNPGSINAGVIVDSIELFDQANFQGESCTVSSGSFSGECNDEDWRWRAQSVRFNFGGCRLIEVVAPWSLDDNIIATPATRTIPVAAGSCDQATQGVEDNVGIYNRLSANYLLNIGVPTRELCTASDAIPQTFEVDIVDLNTGNSGSLSFDESIPRYASCVNRPIF
ncbi:Uncharacterised protein [BD1-7 clade bacterium]|uniref:Uncharacterized protein n=1 Tax=BD1-7 clade bacterium TaxID=2029982 RepID=A0A5S9N611_9GAMM|nr:Uncharacterised protein [BD1-7 clade bacterium]